VELGSFVRVLYYANSIKHAKTSEQRGVDCLFNYEAKAALIFGGKSVIPRGKLNEPWCRATATWFDESFHGAIDARVVNCFNEGGDEVVWCHGGKALT
jgi:hypothetical protein